MKRLQFNRPNNLSKLHDELLAAIPALRPVLNTQDRQEAVMRVEGSGDTVWLEVPNTADTAAIGVVVQAHDSLPEAPHERSESGGLQLTPSEQRRSRITELLAIPRSGWTVAQYRELLQLVAQEQIQ